MNTLITKFITAASAACLLASCQNATPVAQIQGSGQLSSANVIQLQSSQNQISKTQVLRMGEEPGASFQLRIRNQVSDGFSVKQSVSGSAAAASADVATYDVLLIESSTAPTGVLTTAQVKGSATGITSSTEAFLFDNVTANSTGMKYYVVIKAKDGGSNVLNKDMGISHEGDFVAVSNGGGDGSGGVSVGADLSIADNAELTLALNLKDAVGAQLDAQASIVDGADNTGTVSITSP